MLVALRPCHVLFGIAWLHGPACCGWQCRPRPSLCMRQPKGAEAAAHERCDGVPCPRPARTFCSLQDTHDKQQLVVRIRIAWCHW